MVPMETHIGGHLEWDTGSRMIGAIAGRQAIYDTETQRMETPLGNSGLFPDPEGDIALSPSLEWFANGYKKHGEMFYILYNRNSGKTYHAGGFDLFGKVSGNRAR